MTLVGPGSLPQPKETIKPAGAFRRNLKNTDGREAQNSALSHCRYMVEWGSYLQPRTRIMAKTKPLILIVEDEKDMAALIAEQLEESGMYTQVFHRIAPAAKYLSKNFVNLMLLDVNLPDGTGFNLVDELHQLNVSVPTIFLTAANAEVQKVKGLQMGGDDYITKPFSFPELIARINAVLRRSETAKDTQITRNARLDEKPFGFCGAEVNPQRLEIHFPDGQMEKIGRKELGILAYLVSNPRQILTRQSLIHGVWGVHADVRSRSLDQYIVKIREAYDRHACSLAAFRTIHGVGYIYEAEGEPAEPTALPAKETAPPKASSPSKGLTAKVSSAKG
jgi:DNA-binding response OmpR family regulator